MKLAWSTGRSVIIFAFAKAEAVYHFGAPFSHQLPPGGNGDSGTLIRGERRCLTCKTPAYFYESVSVKRDVVDLIYQ